MTPVAQGPRVVRDDGSRGIDDVLGDLDLGPISGALLFMAGSADLEPRLESELKHLVQRAVGPVLNRPGFLLIDGATASGAVGLAAGGPPDRAGIRLGIAPASKVNETGTPDGTTHAIARGHTHLLLTQGEAFGDETGRMLELVASLIRRGVPTVGLLVNGGAIATAELRGLASLKAPVYIVGGSRRLAHTAAAIGHPKGVWARARGAAWWSLQLLAFVGRPFAPEATATWRRRSLRRVLLQSEIHVHHLNDGAGGLLEDLRWELCPDRLLKAAWQRYGTYDRAAKQRQGQYRTRLRLALVLSVATTVLALLSHAEQQDLDCSSSSGFICAHRALVDGVLRWGLLLVPAGAALTSATLSRLSHDKQWVALRSAAETLKAEVFKFRGGVLSRKTLSGGVMPLPQHARRLAGARQQDEGTERDARRALASRLDAVEDFLLDRGIELAAIAPDTRRPSSARRLPLTTEETMLSSEQYVNDRVQDQLGYFLKTGGRLHRDLVRLIMVVPSLAFAGAILGARRQEVALIVVAALVTALGAWYQSQTIRESLGQTSRAVQGLRRVTTAWQIGDFGGVGGREQLVNKTEAILQAEHSGWVGVLDAQITRASLPENQRL